MPWKAFTIPTYLGSGSVTTQRRGMGPHPTVIWDPKGVRLQDKGEPYLNPHPSLQSHIGLQRSYFGHKQNRRRKKKKHFREVAIDQPSYRFTSKNKYLWKARKPSFHHVLKTRSALWHPEVAKAKPLYVNPITKFFQGNYQQVARETRQLAKNQEKQTCLVLNLPDVEFQIMFTILTEKQGKIGNVSKKQEVVRI